LSNEHDWDPHSDSFQGQEDIFHELEEQSNSDKDRHIYQIASKNRGPTYDIDFGQILPALDEHYFIAATNTSNRMANITAKSLANKWCIGLETAKKTLRCTIQKEVRNTLHPVERRFRTKQAQLQCNQLSGRHG